MPILRKIVFYIFAAIYLVVCPILILRLLGFIYNPAQHQFIKTGIIYVSTNPPGANVYINDTKAPEKSPTMIRDLLPGNYRVRLSLEGYQEWTNTIPVEERKASVLENILLIPPSWIIKPLGNMKFENLQILGDENSLLVYNNQNIKDLYLLRINKTLSDEIIPQDETLLLNKLLPAESIYNNAKIIRFFTVDKSPFFIIHILVDEKDKYLWVDVKDKQIHLEDISDLIPLEPQRLWWEANDEKIIYVFTKDQINRIDIKAKAIFPDISPKDVPTAKKIPFQIANLKGSIPDENKTLWLVFTDTKIGFWNKNSKLVNWLFENGRNIQQAYWANNAGTILFRDEGNIYLLDRELFGQVRMQKIATSASGSPFLYSEKTGKIYFVNEKGRLLSTVQILKHTPMIPKTIADKLQLKKEQK